MIDDRELLIGTATIQGEAEDQGREGMVAVAWVLKNRCAIRQKSLIEVCLEPLQFSCWNSRHHRRAELLMDTGPHHRAAKAALLDVWDGREPDPTLGSDHYYAVSIDPPSWAEEYGHTVTIGAHRFFNSRL